MPHSLGHRAQAVVANGFVFCGGHIGVDAATGALAEGGMRGQAEAALRSLRLVLEATGSSLTRVVKLTVFITDFDAYPAFNEVTREVFGDRPPTRSVVVVKDVALHGLLEVDAIALAGEGQP